MVKDSDFKEINEAYLELVRDELSWLYSIIDLDSMYDLESKLVKLNQQMLTTLAIVITQKQLKEESNNFTNMIEMFKISRN